MRQISFMLTTEAARQKTKDITRRLGWSNVKVGDRLQQVVKSQGLKRGEHVEKIHVIEVVSKRFERLDSLTVDGRYPGRVSYTQEEAINEIRREGFPGITPEEFVTMFCQHNGCSPDVIVNRIEFKYL